ncbi:S-Ena type endospore appendage [Guptibacillus hwajinpoensis]|uniref:S-Ena type endospore appendage n=1 Tax=Guptibacillus hwajinpoensis TaxID=208199 RepID=UPI001CFE4DA6|nr:S-Ena type endospore appendage [Pseudalkalibacillus hwajinpoensis]WLR60078.1 hypothetical protein LC071_01400 [Pseudalkalibacillus hwajinpoensis]
MCNSNSASSFCCPAPCSTPNFFGSNPTLMAIKRCFPVRVACTAATPVPPNTLYTAPASTPLDSLASGIVSIINTSSTTSECIMTVTITEAGQAPVGYVIPVQSTQVIQVTDLTSITIECIDDTDPEGFCTATVEMDLQYTAGQ